MIPFWEEVPDMSATYDFDCECDNFEMMEDQDAFSMNEGIPGPGVPAGGSAGQILQKKSQEDYDTEWVTPDGYVPAGGSAGQILKKSSAEDYDTEWDSLDAGDVSFDSSLTYAAGSVGKEICDVKNTFDALTVETGNMFSALNASHEWVNDNGSTIKLDSTLVTDYKPVEAGAGYLVQCSSTMTNIELAWYDSNKEFISRSTQFSGTTLTATAPSGAAYAKAGIYAANEVLLNIEFAYQHKFIFCKISDYVGYEVPYLPNMDTIYDNITANNCFSEMHKTLEQGSYDIYGRKIISQARVRGYKRIYVGVGSKISYKSNKHGFQMNFIFWDSAEYTDNVSLNEYWKYYDTIIAPYDWVTPIFRNTSDGAISPSDINISDFDVYINNVEAQYNYSKKDNSNYSLWNTYNFDVGYIGSDGAVQSEYYTSAVHSYPIEVEPGENYWFKINNKASFTGVCFAWYKEDMTFIKRDNHYPFNDSNFYHEAPVDSKYLICGLFGVIGTTSGLLIDNEVGIYTQANNNKPYNIPCGSAVDYPLRNKVNTSFAFDGKRISILGDSISTFAGAGSTPAGHAGHITSDGEWTYQGNCCRYPSNNVTEVAQTYWYDMLSRLGMKLGVNDSWAGSCVSWDGSEGSDYGENIYIASPTRIGHLDDNGTPDYILVNAGTNDIGTGVTIGTFNTENPVNYTDEQIAALPVATFSDAYRAMIIRLQKAYPLAQVIVMLPNYTTSYYNPTNADKYLEIIKECCDFFGIPWIDMRATGINIFNTSTYTGDGVHPNPSGMKLMSDKLVKYFISNIT